jgi:hypothetical protein
VEIWICTHFHCPPSLENTSVQREAELLAQYPQLVHEDVLAAIAYGAEVARERVVPVPTERVP